MGIVNLWKIRIEKTCLCPFSVSVGARFIAPEKAENFLKNIEYRIQNFEVKKKLRHS